MTTVICKDITSTTSSLLPSASIELWSNSLGFTGSSPMLEREQGELKPPREPELAEDGREVSLDGALRHVQTLGDLLVARPHAQQVDDLPLARGDTLEPLVGPTRRVPPPLLGQHRQLLEQVRDELAADPDLPLQDHVGGLLEEHDIDVPLTVATSAGLENRDAFALVGGL